MDPACSSIENPAQVYSHVTHLAFHITFSQLRAPSI